MERASDLRGAFGWSLPFDPGLVEAKLFEALRDGGLVEANGALWRSRLRASRVGGRLFLHSAFPTDDPDSVFLGPDTVRFTQFLRRHLASAAPARRLIDVGAGAGVGGILAADLLPGAEIEFADLNETALDLARVNAAYHGVAVRILVSDGLGRIRDGFDIAVMNPPFIADEGGPAYRAGGGALGSELSLRWAIDAASKLAPGGRVLLYTGSAVVAGRDQFRETLEARLPALGCTLDYAEIDPDIFGEELDKPAYRQAERIAAVGAVIDKPG